MDNLGQQIIQNYPHQHLGGNQHFHLSGGRGEEGGVLVGDLLEVGVDPRELLGGEPLRPRLQGHFNRHFELWAQAILGQDLGTTSVLY